MSNQLRKHQRSVFKHSELFSKMLGTKQYANLFHIYGLDSPKLSSSTSTLRKISEEAEKKVNYLKTGLNKARLLKVSKSKKNLANCRTTCASQPRRTSPFLHALQNSLLPAKKQFFSKKITNSYKVSTLVRNKSQFSPSYHIAKTYNPRSVSVLDRYQSVPRLDIQASSALGFHQEFMDKVDEFSESWRCAMKEGR